MEVNEEKRKKFMEFAGKRVNNVMHDIQILEPMARSNSYDFTKEDVEKMLIGHKENEGKKTEIELKLDEYQQRLDYAGTVYEDTENEVIENMQIAGQPYDSIHSNTNKITDKVSSTAMNYQKELNYINKEDRDFLKSEINKLEVKKDLINKKVVRVKSWLDKLDDR